MNELPHMLKASLIFAAALVVSLPAQAAHVRGLAPFGTRGSAGYAPYIDAEGDVFTTSFYGGRFGLGTIFMVAPNGAGTVLHDFTGGRDGAHPDGGVIGDAAGNLYGTTTQGGPHTGGTLFKLAPDGRFTTLHAFDVDGEWFWHGNHDAIHPAGSIVFDASGNLYGAAVHGGASNAGAIFKYAADGTWSLLHSFDVTGGSQPRGVVLGPDGALYGTTLTGGQYANGTLYKLSTQGAFDLIHAFGAADDGQKPLSEVAVDNAGNVYGTTTSGPNASSCGVVFHVTPGGTETVLHIFKGGSGDGCAADGRTALDTAGNVYGTTVLGGKYGFPTCGDESRCGVLFRIAPDGTENILHNFDGGSTGANPNSGLVSDGHGRYYGASSTGGGNGAGAVFELN
jgi:uncharacterized repeat protein (TIGR03803 family)